MRDWLYPDAAFSPEDQRYFAERRVETNLGRCRILAGLTTVGAIAAALAQWVHPIHSHADVLRRNGMLMIHGIGLVGALVLLAISYSASEHQAIRYLRVRVADLFTWYLVMFGAGASSLAQHSSGSLHEWAMAAMVPAGFLFIRGRSLFLSYTCSIAIVLTAIWSLRPGDPERAMSSVVLMLFSFSMFVFSRLLQRQFVLDAAVRLDFERLSLSLDSQVQEQMSELSTHTAEVERLNAVLSERVRETSRELSAALARLSRGEGMSGSLPAGTVLGERVTVDRVIGRGGMGMVYQGWDRVTENSVAVKVVHVRSEDELDTMFRTLREAEAIATLRHPAIVRTEHVGLSKDGQLFIVLELVEGRTLSSAITTDSIWNQGRVARLGAVLADALDQAHTAGVVHRDVKPENIMLIGDAPGVKLLDFGLAKLREQHDVAITSPEKILGTPEYLSPEQVVDPSTIGPPTDIYGLGLILYRLLAGRAPYTAKSASEWISRHAFAKPTPLPHALPSVDPALSALVMRCLEKSPADRPTASDLRSFFQAFAERVHEPPIEVGELARGARKRTRTTPTGPRAVMRQQKV